MADETEHQGYSLPDRGESGWGELLNENFERLDEDTRLVVSRADPATDGESAGVVTDDAGELVIGDGLTALDDPDRPGIGPGDGRVFVGTDSGFESDPVAVGRNATASETAVTVGSNSVAPPDSVVVGADTDASGSEKSTVVGQSNAPDGNGEVIVGHGNEGARGAVTIGAGVSNYPESVSAGRNAEGANRNSVAIGSHANENAPSLNDRWGGIRVAVGSRASANERATAVGPGAGEWGTPGQNAVTIGNQTSAAGDYSIAIGDQSGLGTDGAGVPMVKEGADGAVAIGTAVEVDTAEVARIGAADASSPSPRQLVWQATERLAEEDYRNGEVTLLIDEANGQFLIKGKDSNGRVHEATMAW